MSNVRWTGVHVNGNRPILELEVEDPDAGNALINFSAAGTVLLHVWDYRDNSLVFGSGVGTGGTSSVKYKFTQAQLGTARVVKALFEVRWNGTDVDFLPREGFLEFPIASTP